MASAPGAADPPSSSPRADIAKAAAAPAESILDQISRQMRSAKRVQVIGHTRADGDCLGSLIGVHHILEHFEVSHCLASGELPGGGYEIIPGYSLIESSPKADFKPDLTVFVDCAGAERAFRDWTPPGASINIDHHGTNTRFADVNWVDASMACVGEMLYDLALHAGVPIGADFATALLLSIMTDTGSFRFASVRPRHFDIAADLLRAGADLRLISTAAFESRSRQSVALASAVLSSVDYRCDGRLAWGEIRRETLESEGGARQLPENLASDLRSIRHVQVALLFIEPSNAVMRVSLRGDGSVDLSSLAGEFGGGGHHDASGITVTEGSYTEIRDRILERAERRLSSLA